jgi:DNA-binding LacI/PurR family transcriptional regulator
LRQALTDRGLELPQEQIVHLDVDGVFSLQAAEEKVEALFASWDTIPPHQRPTAIYATNDAIAEIVYMHMLRRGKQIPQELSIVSFGGQERGGTIVNKVTAVVVDETSVGRQAVELIVRSTEHPDITERIRRRVSLSLVEGQTLGSPIASALH